MSPLRCIQSTGPQSTVILVKVAVVLTEDGGPVGTVEKKSETDETPQT